jgi:DUF438 domain-containing protein
MRVRAIGREVRNCHPPKSLDKVEQILAELKVGTKDEAEYWIEMDANIRYFALRDSEGAHQGCLEVVHDSTRVHSLTGNRRTVDCWATSRGPTSAQSRLDSRPQSASREQPSAARRA